MFDVGRSVFVFIIVLNTHARGEHPQSMKMSPVILSPSPAVILSGAKDLAVRLRVNSAKDLVFTLEAARGILRPAWGGSQNDKKDLSA